MVYHDQRRGEERRVYISPYSPPYQSAEEREATQAGDFVSPERERLLRAVTRMPESVVAEVLPRIEAMLAELDLDLRLGESTPRAFEAMCRGAYQRRPGSRRPTIRLAPTSQPGIPEAPHAPSDSSGEPPR